MKILLNNLSEGLKKQEEYKRLVDLLLAKKTPHIETQLIEELKKKFELKLEYDWLGKLTGYCGCSQGGCFYPPSTYYSSIITIDGQSLQDNINPTIEFIEKYLFEHQYVKRIEIYANRVEHSELLIVAENEICFRPTMEYVSVYYDRDEQIEFYTNEIIYTLKTFGYEKDKLINWISFNGKMKLPLYQYVLAAWGKTPSIKTQLRKRIAQELFPNENIAIYEKPMKQKHISRKQEYAEYHKNYESDSK